MKKTPRKIFAFLLIFFIISSSFAKRADANMFTGTVGGDDMSADIDVSALAKQSFNAILDDMGMNKASLKSSVNTFNVTQRKIPAPTVTVSFSPANPVEGEKVTATAMVTNVMNDANQMYYTWYLKNKKCTDKETDNDYHYEASCDEDGDGHVNIEDYKIKAARIIAGNDFDWQNADYSHESTGDSGYKAPSGGGDQVGKKGARCYVHDFRNGLDWPFENCFHLFPNTTHHSDLNDNDNKISDTGEVLDKPSGADMLGDGVFGASEEKFWHTNPYAKDTLGSGNTDEANALGLGQKDFTFTYTNGDKLGVVAEAISTQPTTSSGPSTGGLNPAFRTEWAFVDNSCDFDPCKKSDLRCPGLHDDQPNCWGGNQLARECLADDSTSENIMGDNKDLTTANDYSPLGVAIKNINKDCVAKHFIDPLTGGGATEKLDVNLTYSPQNPINDTSDDKNGDELILSADTSNATNSDYVTYSWKVLAGTDISSDSWTAFDLSDLDGATRLSGLNMKDFKFKMNFPEAKLTANKYLKVQVTAKEELGLDHQREGHTDVIIPINTSADRLSVYNTQVVYSDSTPDTPPSLRPAPDASDHEKCLDKDGKPKGICEVAKDEIITVSLKNNDAKYSDFYWTIDGKPFECIGGENFEGCKAEQATAVNYIPITQPVGTVFSVNLTGTNTKEGTDTSGQKVNLTRVFKVTDPDVTLACGKDDHNCEALLLGKYYDLHNVAYEDRSEASFQALTGDTKITLTPTFSDVFSLEDANKFEWNVDGALLTLDNVTDYGYGIGNHNELTLTPKEYGEYYNITFSGLYVPSGDVRMALNHWWGVSYNDFYEKSITKTVRIEMVKNLPTVTMVKPSDSTSKKVFATVASGIPSYFVFLFRIFLSGAVIIISLKIIFFVILKQE